MPGWTWYPEESMMKKANIKKIYKKRRKPESHKGMLIKRKFDLGQWVSRLRRKYYRGNITDLEIKDLESLPGWVWSLMIMTTVWNESLKNMLSKIKVQGFQYQ